MSWDEIDNAGKQTKESAAALKEKQAAEVELCKKFHRTFSTDDGKVVLDYLFQNLVVNNNIDLSASNIDYRAAYKNGEAGVVKLIISKMSKATNQ